MKLKHWAFLVVASPFLLIGWLVIKSSCAVGLHEWFWRETLRVPFYGIGAWQCLFCERVKVRP